MSTYLKTAFLHKLTMALKRTGYRHCIDTTERCPAHVILHWQSNETKEILPYTEILHFTENRKEPHEADENYDKL
jgi:hypothetical protein